MPEQDKPQTKTDFGERVELALSVFIRAFLRLIIIFVVILCIGLFIYYGFPYLYKQYILPVQSNTTHLQEVQTQQAADAQSFNRRIDALQARLVILEQQHTQDKETLSDLKSRLNSAESLLNSHTTALQRLDLLQTSIDTLNRQIAQAQTDTASLGNELHADNSPLVALQWEVQVLKSMELLSRARLFLIQNNTGLARQDVLAAHTILANQKAQAPSGQQSGLTVLLTRLDLVLNNLPASPVTAADDLEIAWRQLAAGLANNPDATFNTQASGLSPATTPAPSGTPTLAETQLTPLKPTGTPTSTGTLLAPRTTSTVTPAQANTPTQTLTP